MSGVWFLVLGAAWAQDGGFDAHGFRLVTHDADLRDPLTMVRPGNREAGDLYVGGQVEYASRPLVFEPSPDARVVALSNVVGLNLAAGGVPAGPLRVDASVPVFLTSQSGGVGNGAAFGDLRLSGMVSPLQPAWGGGVGLGLLAAVDLPTGDVDAYLGTGGLAALVATTGTVEVDAVTATWSLGGRFAPNTDPAARPTPTLGGDTLQGGLALGAVVAEQTGVMVEAQVDLPTDPAVRDAIGIPANAIASVRYVLPSGGTVSAGVGTGLGLGAGASPIRLLVGGGFGTHSDSATRDLDGDGVVDAVDQCVGEAETFNAFHDDDGCPDELPWATIQLTADGQPVADARMTVERPDGREDPGDGSVKLPVLPGATYQVTGSSGSCLRVQTTVVAPDGGGVIDVPLEAVRGTVVITVTDSIGTPVRDATVRYLIDDDACQALDRTLVDGQGRHEVGIGRHQAYVTADGYDVFQATFELRQDEVEILDARLNPIR